MACKLTFMTCIFARFFKSCRGEQIQTVNSLWGIGQIDDCINLKKEVEGLQPQV